MMRCFLHPSTSTTAVPVGPMPFLLTAKRFSRGDVRIRMLQNDDEIDPSSANANANAQQDATSTTLPIKEDRPPNPLENASILSRIYFLWAYPLVRLGKQRPLEDSDLATLPAVDSSVYQADHLQQILQEEEERSGHPVTAEKKKERFPRLARALFRDYWKRTRRARWVLAVHMASRLAQTVALGRVLRMLDQSSEGKKSSDGYAWAALLVGCGLVAFPTKQQQFFETYRIGIQLRTSLVASVYSKILRLPSVGQESTNLTSGHVTNLASNDVERFVATSVYCNFIVLGPIEAVIILAMGINIIGPIFCAGYALLCLLVPLQFWLSRRFATFRGRIARETDARVGWVSQAVHGARIMKQSGFENMFLDRITQQRHREVHQLQITSRLKALNEAIYFFSSAVVASFVFCVHVARGGTLSPEIVYTTLTLLNILQFTLTKHIPNAVMGLSECYVSCQRLQAFFDLPEMPSLLLADGADKERSGNETSENKSVLSLSKVSCYWDSTNIHDDESAQPSKVALSDISLDFYRGKLYCLIGKIGSGKSACLQALSGELQISAGSVHRQSQSMSYAAQEAWIMDGTVKENILTGLEYDPDWYNQVIDACALRDDIEQFPNGDETIVGDRGVQVSGGQKARIGLARAFYKPHADVILLDDPLSAVDARVAKTIFFSAIQKLGVQRGKCVILVTHQHQFVGMADECILLDQGKVVCTGSFDECLVSSKLSAHNLQMVNASDEVMEEAKKTTPPVEPKQISKKESQEEKRMTGVVKPETWKAYAKAFGGYPICAAFFVIFAITQAAQLVTLVLLGKWGELPPEEQNSTKWFAIIGGTVATLIVLTVVRAQLSFFVLIGCSQKLHDAMTRAVLRAQISFFDTNPLGRILNRFSADVGIVDEVLPLTIYDFLVGAFMFLGSICTAVAVLPFVLLVLPPLAWRFLRLRAVFVATTRELKRLEGLARSPIYAMISETMLGIATIRANGSTDFFARKFSTAHDTHSRAAWAFMASSRWFAISLDVLSFLLLTTATFVSVLLYHEEWLAVDPATLGLALTLLIQMSNQNFPWVVRQSAEVTNQMVSVERILEFCKLEPEAPLDMDADKQLDDSWPSQGIIQLKNLSVRYRQGLPLVLDGINCTIENGSRIGIVGRTGSGKSTFVQSLFRLIEAEDGSITIDGVDIAGVGLHRLRKRISVIPQAPTLFSGCSIRENLDLFGVHSDEQIHRAIEDAHLEEVIDALPSGVDSMVSEGGSNFSVGQRQLLCLARAILSRNKILVLDEATANVDRRTDQLIQDTLEKSFHDGTLIAVAHRLETILHSDSIILMAKGRILEHDPPKALLADGDSHFSAMAKSGGIYESALERLQTHINPLRDTKGRNGSPI